MLPQKWVHDDSLLRRVESQELEHVDLLIRSAWISNIYKYISFSNLSPFVSGQFWIHDVLKNKGFWLIIKNPILTVNNISNEIKI